MKVHTRAERVLMSENAKIDLILACGVAQLPLPFQRTGGRGRIPNTKLAHLHERLVKHRDAVLRFVHDPQAPFTNNLAEQSVRRANVQQKISGCLRTAICPLAQLRKHAHQARPSRTHPNPQCHQGNTLDSASLPSCGIVTTKPTHISANARA